MELQEVLVEIKDTCESFPSQHYTAVVSDQFIKNSVCEKNVFHNAVFKIQIQIH